MDTNLQLFGAPGTAAAAHRIARRLAARDIPTDVYTRPMRGGPMVQCVQVGTGSWALVVAIVPDPSGHPVLGWVWDGWPWSPRDRNRDRDRERVVEPHNVVRTLHGAEQTADITVMLVAAFDAQHRATRIQGPAAGAA
ncbi:hypothetical protein J0910_30985 [Nocardiopsis sp. CNT-189]|uniref:hypothetical protein n=1 Tax=Nocardiopsis oceanisediminis TaxID=2816862 RepID=UPI003B2ACA37